MAAVICYCGLIKQKIFQTSGGVDACSVCGLPINFPIESIEGIDVETQLNTPAMSDSEILISSDFQQLIYAQNRTTHAVRAFVRFIFIQLTGITFAIFLCNISTAFIDQQKCIEYGTNCTGNTFLQFLAVVVWIASVVWSSQAGWDELAKSNID